MSASLWSTALGYYAAAIVSAVVPWVNGELLMMSEVPLAGTRRALAALVIAVTAGHMTGRTLMYWASRKSTRPHSVRVQRSIEHWRVRLQWRPRSVVAVVFLSALVGFPPFFIVSVAAGAIRLAFPRFLAVGVAGRLAHFTVVAFVPEFLARTLSDEAREPLERRHRAAASSIASFARRSASLLNSRRTCSNRTSPI